MLLLLSFHVLHVDQPYERALYGRLIPLSKDKQQLFETKIRELAEKYGLEEDKSPSAPSSPEIAFGPSASLRFFKKKLVHGDKDQHENNSGSKTKEWAHLNMTWWYQKKHADGVFLSNRNVFMIIDQQHCAIKHETITSNEREGEWILEMQSPMHWYVQGRGKKRWRLQKGEKKRAHIHTNQTKTKQNKTKQNKTKQNKTKCKNKSTTGMKKRAMNNRIGANYGMVQWMEKWVMIDADWLSNWTTSLWRFVESSSCPQNNQQDNEKDEENQASKSVIPPSQCVFECSASLWELLSPIIQSCWTSFQRLQSFTCWWEWRLMIVISSTNTKCQPPNTKQTKSQTKLKNKKQKQKTKTKNKNKNKKQKQKTKTKNKNKNKKQKQKQKQN